MPPPLTDASQGDTQPAGPRKRVLLVMIQPPGCSGVQGLIYKKLLPFYHLHGWEVHFAGPAPWLCSVLSEPLDYPRERLHYTTRVSLSRQCSIRKNRHPKGSLPHLVHGGLQLLARSLERLLGHDSGAYTLQGLADTVRQADRRWSFDLIGGKSPDFEVLALTQQLCQELGKPFLALMDDPHGARDEQGFYPTTPERQRTILAAARGTLFMSPLTRERYVRAGLVEAHKAHFISDSYPVQEELYARGRSALAPATGTRPRPLQLVHLGMLPEWRPIEPLLEALRACAHQDGPRNPTIQLAIHGFVYAQARERIRCDPRLAAMIQLRPLVDYTTSHWLAEDADVQLVVIGPRHLDNYPSKFFDYLAHRKPLLILGPPQNPLRQIVDTLRIGIYVDGRRSEAIVAALDTLRRDTATFQQAYITHAEAIAAFSAPQVAQTFCGLLDQALAAAPEAGGQPESDGGQPERDASPRAVG
ncbi:MAG: hypothetical protein ACK59A_04820 [Cyanobacteriota bacterium]